jgi:hypothetical protein
LGFKFFSSDYNYFSLIEESSFSEGAFSLGAYSRGAYSNSRGDISAVAFYSTESTAS